MHFVGCYRTFLNVRFYFIKIAAPKIPAIDPSEIHPIFRTLFFLFRLLIDLSRLRMISR